MDECKDLMGRLERCVMLCRGVFEESGTLPLNDDTPEVSEMCVALEDVLRYRIRDQTAYGDNKDYWDFIFESMHHSTSSPRFPRVNRAVLSVVGLSQLETAAGRGRALLRWGLMYKILAEIVQHALEEYGFVSEWYHEESAVLDESFSNQLIQFLLDLQEIQFHLPSHGHNLDSHWPTHTSHYDAITVNGGVLRITTDIPDRPGTPVPKLGAPTHSRSFPCLSPDSIEPLAPELSIPSEIRLVSSTLRDLKLLIAAISEKALAAEVDTPSPVQNKVIRRNTLAHASLPSKARSQIRRGSGGQSGVETAAKLERLETILSRLAEKEDTRDEIHLLERGRMQLEEESRRSRNRNLDLQLQLTETLNASETSDAELLQELGELQEALRQTQDAEHLTLSAYKLLEQQLNEREVEFEINQELLTQADTERCDLKERCLYLQEDLEEKCYQLDELADELSTIRGEGEICDDTEVEQLAGSQSAERGELIQSLQESVNEKEGELTRSRREQQQMNTVIQAMRDERGRLQKECLEMRAQLPSLEKKNKEKEGRLSLLEAKLVNFESFEEQKTELQHLQGKYKDLQSNFNQTQSANNEKISALEFKISSQKIELENIRAKYTNNQSQSVTVQTELDEVRSKFIAIETELFTKREAVRTSEFISVGYKNEISHLKECNMNAVSTSAVDLEKVARENSELKKLFSLLQEENDTLRDTILKFTKQKLALFTRADELEHELEKLLLAKWIEDLYIKTCLICRKHFSNSLRKHHCRLCGKVLCNECTREKIFTPSGREAVRCCIPCADFRNRFLCKPHLSKEIVNNNVQPILNSRRSSRDSYLSITSMGDTYEVNMSQSGESIVSNRTTLSRSSFDLKSIGSEYHSPLDDVKVISLTRDAPYECLVGDYSEIIVHPKRAHCEDVIVSSGMTIVWEFVTERPIQFRLTYRSTAISGIDCKEHDVVPFTSYGATNKDLPHIGHYAVEKPGVYRLVFSNETSILQSRKISYKVKLTNTHK